MAETRTKFIDSGVGQQDAVDTMNSSKHEWIFWWGAAAVLLGLAFYATSRAPKKPDPGEAWEAEMNAEIDTVPGLNEIARSSGGHVIWYGNELDPPYVFAFHSEIKGLFINGLPTEISKPPPEMTPETQALLDLTGPIYALARSLFSTGHTAKEVGERLEQRFLGSADGLDSVVVAGDTVEVHVRDLRYPLRITAPRIVTRPGDRPEPPQGGAVVRQFAKTTARSLDRGRVVVFGRGVRTIPATMADSFLAEARRVKNSGPGAPSVLMDSVLQVQLARPVPMGKHRLRDE
jgi:hypothetical protein